MDLHFEEGAYLSKLHRSPANKKTYFSTLCTGWNTIEQYVNMNIDIIGTLYTKNGAQIVLRNLLSNPNIKLIIILDTNILGQNNVGKHGLNLLYQCFFKGARINYDTDNLVNNIIIYYITPQTISVRVKNTIREIPNSYESDIQCIQSILSSIETDTYVNILNTFTRETKKYQPDVEMKLQYTPNEYMGMSIRGNSLFDTWYTTLKHVYRYGITNGGLHEYHSIHWNFPVENLESSLQDMRKVITQSDIQQLIGLDEQVLKDYSKIMNTNLVIPKSAYTYGNRLAIYKERIKQNLSKDIKTRYAFGTTLKYDTNDAQAPCMVYIQLLYDCANEKMNLYATFRSHDIFKASLANGYALCQMLIEYCNDVHISFGRIEITSISAHIYKCDMNNVKLFTECIDEYMKKQEIIHFDPRGNCIINKLSINQYHCEIRHPTENTMIFEMTGTPIDIYKHILEKEIIINVEHLRYIFNQLFIT